VKPDAAKLDAASGLRARQRHGRRRVRDRRRVIEDLGEPRHRRRAALEQVHHPA
jgi:hypothetical protein